MGQQLPKARVEGAVYTYQGETVDGPVSMRWMTGPSKEVVRQLSTDHRGGYTVEGIDADVLYWVEIEGSVGLPSAVRPEKGPNYRFFLMAPSRETTATVGGKVLANDGSDLPGRQQMRWARASDEFWVTPEFATTDNGSYQTYEVLVPLGIEYKVYVNRGLAIPNTYTPMDYPYNDQDFRRNTGTASVSMASPSGDFRMQWKDTGGAWVTYRFRIVNPGNPQLVSVPAEAGGTEYHIMAKPAGTPDFATTTPTPPGADPHTLPHRDGDGSDDVDCTLP